MAVDFYLLRHRTLHLPSLYRRNSIYSYTSGVNPRAFAAFVTGIALNLPGLAAAVGNQPVPKAFSYIYSLSWLVGAVVGGLVYWGLGWVWPVEEASDEVPDEISDGVSSDVVSGYELQNEKNMRDMEKTL